MHANQSAATRFVTRRLLRQFRFPSLSRCLAEAFMLSMVFLATGIVSLGIEPVQMLAPMVPVVLVMMLSSVASGVYREEITNSIINIYVHTAYGFLLGSIAFAIVLQWLPAAYSDLRFVFLFLFTTFFVTNTVRPLISGTDFMDGGGRRGN